MELVCRETEEKGVMSRTIRGRGYGNFTIPFLFWRADFHEAGRNTGDAAPSRRFFPAGRGRPVSKNNSGAPPDGEKIDQFQTPGIAVWQQGQAPNSRLF